MYKRSFSGLLSLLALVVAGALSFGETRPAGDSSRDALSLERIVPASIEWIESEPPETPESDPWNLFDADTGRAFAPAGGGAVRLRLTLDGPRSIAGLATFGGSGGELSLFAEIDGRTLPISGLEDLYLNAQAPAWHRFKANENVRARVLVAEWRPLSAAASLPEIELWSHAEAPLVKDRLPKIDGGKGGVRWIAGDSLQAADSSSPRDSETFQFHLGSEPGACQWISLPIPSSAPCSTTRAWRRRTSP